MRIDLQFVKGSEDDGCGSHMMKCRTCAIPLLRVPAQITIWSSEYWHQHRVITHVYYLLRAPSPRLPVVCRLEHIRSLDQRWQYYIQPSASSFLQLIPRWCWLARRPCRLQALYVPIAVRIYYRSLQPILPEHAAIYDRECVPRMYQRTCTRTRLYDRRIRPSSRRSFATVPA